MKFTLLVTAFLFTIGSYAQDFNWNYEYNKENVVTSALEGKWSNENIEITCEFVNDSTVLPIIPKKYHEFFLDKTVYQAGYFNITMDDDDVTHKNIYVIIVLNGNPCLVYFRERKGVPYDDFESNYLFVSIGKSKQEDVLHLGGDFNNQAFRPFKRIE